MYLLRTWPHRPEPTRMSVDTVIAYCATAWDGPGAGLAELHRDCVAYASHHGLRIVAWVSEVVADDPAARNTPALACALAQAQTCDGLLIAESSTLPRTAGPTAALCRHRPVGAET